MTRKSRRPGADSVSRSDDRANPTNPSSRHDHLGPDTPRPTEVTDVKPGLPNMSDEAGDVSLQNADNPMIVREEVGNTSTSSGTHHGDDGDDQQRKEKLRRGFREISRMD